MTYKDVLWAVLLAILAFVAISFVAAGIRSVGLFLFVIIVVGVWIYLKKTRG